MGNMIFNQHQIWAPHVQLSLLYHLLPIWKEIIKNDGLHRISFPPFSFSFLNFLSNQTNYFSSLPSLFPFLPSKLSLIDWRRFLCSVLKQVINTRLKKIEERNQHKDFTWFNSMAIYTHESKQLSIHCTRN